VSVDLFVVLNSGRLPNVESWQAELGRLSAPVELDRTVDPASHTGFWPIHIDGTASGFEFLTGSVSDCLGDLAPNQIDGRDLVAQFTTHSDMSELRGSMLAAAGLASLTNGLIVDGETGELTTIEELLDQERSIAT
jgi:hypothetical protein